MSNSKMILEASTRNKPETFHEKSTKLTTWKDFFAIIKIGIVNSNLITTFTGVWLALHFTEQSFLNQLDVVFATLLGTSLIIAGSCSLNNYIDRDIDRLMTRTKDRPTVTGKIDANKVLLMGITFIVVGLLLLFYTTMTALIIGILGIIIYVVIYSMWAKRKLVSNTVIGAFSGVSPLIGWAAIDGNLPFMAWMIFLIMFIWQPPHFYALAMRRTEEYRNANIPMLPVVRGLTATKRSINLWVAALLPIPFFMKPLGIPFIVIATALNIGWLILGLTGYRLKDDMKWATYMFVYSLNYITIMFVTMIIVTFI